MDYVDSKAVSGNGDSRFGPDDSPPDEYTTLLPNSLRRRTPDGGHDDEISGIAEPKPVLVEFWKLLQDAVPVIVAYMLQMSLQTVTVIVVGRSSPENLATSAFSLMFAMATGGIIALGGTTALDTLASSTFTGSVDKHAPGVLLQRAFFILGLYYIPVALVWTYSDPIFRALGQDPELSYQSSRFLTVLIPGGLGYIYFEVMKKYLQAQGIMRAGTYVLAITSPLNAGLCYLFCYTFKIGMLGAPIAASISYWVSFILLVLYSRFVDGSECWGGWSRSAFQNLGTFARLALLGILHIGTEWWAFEIVALVAGNLGRISLAAQSVIMTADQILNTIPFGLGVATSSRVGNKLGKRDARGVYYTAHMSALLSVSFGIIVLAILMGSRNHFAKIFNDDPRVVELTSKIMPFVALFQIADGINGSCGGTLRGMGRQHLGAAVNIISYYCFALPLGIYLAFHGWGLAGLWMGNCLALWCAGLLEWMIVSLTDWQEEVRKAFNRMDGCDSPEV
ncbi:transporter [Penicillium argentinense]|uniref:Transporter n=1 Tax=Penicillium argentinense TaxID=1131581 RepID=A0A9W9FE92_9EURO|nr:transporter [Penicillium argentinense]KAJ5098630.1 transporter [Penicillium argentinense]